MKIKSKTYKVVRDAREYLDVELNDYSLKIEDSKVNYKYILCTNAYDYYAFEGIYTLDASNNTLTKVETTNLKEGFQKGFDSSKPYIQHVLNLIKYPDRDTYVNDGDVLLALFQWDELEFDAECPCQNSPVFKR